MPTAQEAVETARDSFRRAKRLARGARHKRRTNPDWSAWRMGEARDQLRHAISWRNLAVALATPSVIP